MGEHKLQTITQRYEKEKKKRLWFHQEKTGLIKDVTKLGKLAELSLSPELVLI